MSRLREHHIQNRRDKSRLYGAKRHKVGSYNFIYKQPAPPAPHWVNTSSNDLVRELLESGGSEMREDLQSLLAGGM